MASVAFILRPDISALTEVSMDSFKCEVFLTAVDLGSITAAGDFLGYTQPGVTRIIRSLEEEVGFPLLTRTRKGVSLTENGKAMMPIFRDMVLAGKTAIELAGEIRGITTGTLVIGSYYSVSAMLLPGILSKFQKMYPSVKIRLKEGGNDDLARWLTNRSIDFCFAVRPSPDVECDWIPVMDDELTVWLPAEHPLAAGINFPVKAIQNERFIATMPGHDTEIDRLLKDEGLSPDIAFSTADAYAAYRMVEAGLGISVNNKLFTEKWTGMVNILPLDPPAKITLGIAVPSLREASPATKKFIDLICRSIGRHDTCFTE